MTYEGICMVEGTANHISEAEFLDALFLAHDVIKKQVVWQQEIIKEMAFQKKPLLKNLIFLHGKNVHLMH